MPSGVAHAAPGAVSGVVFRDHNQNGVQDLGEPGQGGIEVRGVAAGQPASGPVTSLADGTFSLPTAETAPTWRVQFTIPASHDFLEPGPYPDPATVGSPRNGGGVQFVAGDATGVTFGVARPADFCQASDPGGSPSSAIDVATPCYTFGPTSGAGAVNATREALVGFEWGSTGDLSGLPGDHVVATHEEVGTIWGLAPDLENDGWFAATYIRRHVGIVGDPGRIMRVSDAGGSASVSTFVDLPAGTDPHPADTDPTDDWLKDPGTWDAVGKVGLGDIDLSEDRDHLFALNLFDRSLYRIEIADPTNVSSVAVPTPSGCAADDWRPFGIGVTDGRVYVGGVCSKQSDQTVDGAFAAHVWRSTDATGSVFEGAPALSFGLDYTRKCGDAPGGGSADNGNASAADNTNDADGSCETGTDHWVERAAWQPWLDGDPTAWASFPVGGGNLHPRHSSPMLTDIEFDGSGDMILGLRSRFGDQQGNGTPAPGDDAPFDTLWRGIGLGDILKACESTGTFTLEAGGSCGGTAGPGAGNGEGPGGGEFFNGDDHFFHDQLGNGGVLGLATEAEVADTMFDPLPAMSETFDGGVTWHTSSSGSRSRALRVFNADTGDPDVPGKANGLGDLEALCDNAPLQIGDRIWLDTDRDGVQDPDEVGIEGVKVTVTPDGGAALPTVTTGADGLWFVGIDPDTAYTVTIDVSMAVGVTPGDLRLTLADQGGDDELDSDAVEVSAGVYEISVAPHGAGENDHGFDAGFFEADPQRIGNLVWLDADRDGVVGATETELGGVDVELWVDDGDMVFEPGSDPGDDTLFATTTTGASGGTDGEWWFGGLGDGDYFVAIPDQAGLTDLVVTAAGAGGTTDNDNNGVAGPTGYAAVSDKITMTEATDQPTGETDASTGGGDDEAEADAGPTGPHDDADSNLTVDIGFFEAHAIGNHVWHDLDDSGTFDSPTESGIDGVSVNLLDGGDDSLLDTTTTAGGGLYVFDDLAPGDYKVEVDASNFGSGQVLEGYTSSTPTDTADNGEDEDDNGTPVGGAVQSPVIALGDGPEPTGEDPTSATTASDANGDLTIDFGFWTAAELGDFVWFDVNGDGDQDPSEPPVEGVTVNLRDDGGTGIDVDTTDASGEYLFADLAPETYSVQFVLPLLAPGVGWTLQDAGGDDADDSDADPGDGTTANTTLESGESDLTWDAGIVIDADISVEKQVEDPDTAGTWYNADALDGEVPIQDRWVAHLAGDQANYRFVITNTGATHLSDVVLDDPTAGLGADCPTNLTVVASPATLAPGASIIVDPDPDCLSDPLAAAFTNTADVAATPATPGGDAIEDELGLPPGTIGAVTDDDPAEVRPIEASIRVDKAPNTQTIPASQASVTFAIEVENTSAGGAGIEPVVALQNVQMTDVTSLGGTCDSVSQTGDGDGDALLELGEIWTYDCTVDQPGGGWPDSWTNKVTFTAEVPPTDPDGYPYPDAEDPMAMDTVSVLTADLGVTKEVREQGADVGQGAPGPWMASELVRDGEGVDWLVTVSNPGGATLTDVTLASDCADLNGSSVALAAFLYTEGGGSGITGDNADGLVTLGPDEAWQFICDGGSIVDPTTCTTTVTGTPEGSTTPLIGEASADVTPIEPHVSVLLEVDDPFLGWIDADADAGTEGSNDDSIATITKGTDVEYRVTVWNADSTLGNHDDLTLTGVHVDVMLPGGQMQALDLPSLLAGGSHTFPTFTATNVTSPDDAIAKVSASGSERGGEQFGPVDGPYSGTGADGELDGDDDDRARVQLASLVVKKYVRDEGGTFRDAQDEEPAVQRLEKDDVDYQVTLTNDGDVDLAVTGLDDDLAPAVCTLVLVGGDDGDAVLEPGETWIYECTVVGGFVDVDTVRNNASATADPVDDGGTPIGPELDDEDEANVELIALAEIGDRVWLDLDADGVQDPGEVGVPDVTVRLLAGDCSTVLDETTTDADGLYLFPDLRPGDYCIEVVAPEGFMRSPQDAGGDDALDSDVDPSTGLATTTTLDEDESDRTWDVGLFEKAELGDFVWLDADRDGIQDPDEDPIGDVRVDLLASACSTVLATTTTDADGLYLFTGLVPGAYRVRFTTPDGFLLTTLDAGGDDGVDSDAGPDGCTEPVTLQSGDSDRTWDAGMFPREVDLTIDKTGVLSGTTVVWTLLVTNNGPDDDPGPITVTDPIPEPLTPVSASGDGWTCTISGQLVTCELAGGLAAGEDAAPILVATDATGFEVDVVNVATVSSETDETTDANNSDDAAIRVSGQGALPETGGPFGVLALVGVALVAVGATLDHRSRVARSQALVPI